MWKWTCPKDPNIIMEHHSFKQLDEMLQAHENGVVIPGFKSYPGCGLIHDYWDDGEPCSFRGHRNKGCRIPYIPDPNGPDQ
jgi:hypothetical protein